jgi:hypothetical protein
MSYLTLPTPILSDHDLAVVNIGYGPHDLDLPFGGITVAEAELAVRDFLNLGGPVERYVDGHLVWPTYRLLGGERLEFMKVWGRKGGREPVDPRRPVDPRHQTNQLLWEVLQEIRELNTSLSRIADYFDPPARHQSDVTGAITALEAKLDQLASQTKPEREPTKKEWYTPKETTEVVPQYKEATIRQACNLGRIPEAKKISRQWRIPREAVERIANLGLPPLAE